MGKRFSEMYLGNIMGPPGPQGETPDLSDYVKFVNGVGPDENGNVIIAGETADDFKVYRVVGGYSVSSSYNNLKTFKLTQEGIDICQELINDYLGGLRKQLLIFDKFVVNYGLALVFVTFENRSSLDTSNTGIIRFQCLTPIVDVENRNRTNYTEIGPWTCNFSLMLTDGVITGHELVFSQINNLKGITLENLQAGDYTLNGLHTYNKLPQSSVAPTDAKDLVNKAYVDSLGGGGASGDSGVVTLTTDVINSLLEEYGITTLTWGALYLKYGGGVFYVPQNFTFMLNGGYSTTLTKGSTIMLFGSGFSGIIFHGAPADTRKCISFHYDNGSSITASDSMSYFTYVENFRSSPYHAALAKLNYLAKDNTTAYTPTQSYHPATKQYVDNAVTNALGDIESLLSEV